MSCIEIERKFLIKNETWKNSVKKREHFKQIYFAPEFFHCLFHIDEGSIFFEIHNDNEVLRIQSDPKTSADILSNKLIKFDKANNFNLNNDLWTSRLRLIEDENKNQRAEITIKGPNSGIEKPEYNFNVKYDKAEALFVTPEAKYCRRIEKIRNIMHSPDVDALWVIDEFSFPESVNGLIMAEVEIPTADHHLDLPSWIGEEVSENPRYFNKNMI